ncbi:TetR/AcrR family transcriptional regulator [Agromyces protaetiae]|uniref:TetR/AcrR family transcriptional regulator n=1 Tax=Agromyces protaetiae TaxID=2509455 RepID=A0A4V0YGV2_9MICO|nr:TetR/AcrR family transcriptional regulator [Agromyces protaetiae]QAY72501.1 TetR/AcrR family transcriptional regulator [Agromyces protaetiae]
MTVADQTQQAKPVRDGNAQKRAAILAAARALFVRDGVERTSMDAIAAEAGVSKRTVYDYYGDKRGLLLGVIEDAGATLVAALDRALDTHLSDDADLPDVPSLERALVAFADDVGTTMIATTDYAATVRLVTENTAWLPDLDEHPLATAPEEALAERFAHFAAIGLVDADDPRLAADHFNALTTLLAFNGSPTGRTPERIRQVMADGVHAWIRAYGARDRG